MKTFRFIVVVIMLAVIYLLRSLWFRHLDYFAPEGSVYPLSTFSYTVLKLLSAIPKKLIVPIKYLSALLFIFLYYRMLVYMTRSFLKTVADTKLAGYLYGGALLLSAIFFGTGKLMHFTVCEAFGKFIFVWLQSPVPLMILFFGFYLKRTSETQ